MHPRATDQKYLEQIRHSQKSSLPTLTGPVTELVAAQGAGIPAETETPTNTKVMRENKIAKLPSSPESQAA